MKEKIIFYLKVFMVFLFEYLLVWYLLGLPMEWWASALLVVLAGISEYATIRWIGRTDNG
ncbi:MAG: hypothetical protein IJX37_07690 [Oscillospiraceae bacterium]|nr:hypothetical protein [Oscillospiraceae bacterium]